jgi:hypothetical protein
MLLQQEQQDSSSSFSSSSYTLDASNILMSIERSIQKDFDDFKRIQQVTFIMKGDDDSVAATTTVYRTKDVVVNVETTGNKDHLTKQQQDHQEQKEQASFFRNKAFDKAADVVDWRSGRSSGKGGDDEDDAGPTSSPPPTACMDKTGKEKGGKGKGGKGKGGDMVVMVMTTTMTTKSRPQYPTTTPYPTSSYGSVGRCIFLWGERR